MSKESHIGASKREGLALSALLVVIVWLSTSASALASPIVNITQPLNNAVFAQGANITITASASETDTNATIISVDFYAGATWLGNAISTPYNFTWSGAPAGTNILTAVATDSLSQMATSAPVSIVVDIPPTAGITIPTNNADFTVPATITISAMATDSVGTVTSVEFFANNVSLGKVTTPPFNLVWSGAALGIYDLTAQATDNNGLSTLSAPVRVFVTTIGGALTGSLSIQGAGTLIDLTSLGTNDWVDWGLFTPASFNRKAGVAQQISNFTPIGTDTSQVYQFADNPIGYSWHDGTPDAAATNTTTGLYVVGSGTGFQLSSPADTNMRTLTVYVGAYDAQGAFQAYLSDFSAPVYIDTSEANSGNGPAAVYSLSYAAASAGQTLIVTYTTAQSYGSFGNVTLQAATLSSGDIPPYVAITNPTPGQVVGAPANLTIGAAASDPDGTVSKVEFFQGATKLGQSTNSPYIFTWTNVPASNYVLTAVATDNRGVTYTSSSVNLFVTNAGGVLFGSLGAPASTVDLTAISKSDWADWGVLSGHGNKATFFNHKASVAQQISDVTNATAVVTGSPFQTYTDNLSDYSWSDGTPIPATNVEGGIYKDTLNEGFQITAPADSTLRRLRVYLGAFAGQGRLQATLSDFSATPFVDTSVSSLNSTAAVYTLIYSAAPGTGKKLNILYTSSQLYDEQYGNVTLQAASLASAAPTLTVASPTSPGVFSFSLLAEQALHYSVQFNDSVRSTNWQTLTNLTGQGASVTITDPVVSNRFYRAKWSR